MGLHSHEEVTENLFQGFVHNHHVNDINHVIAHKQTSLSVRSGAIFPLPLAYARFAAPVLSHHEKARRRRWLRMSHHRFKVAPVAVGALASGFVRRKRRVGCRQSFAGAPNLFMADCIIHIAGKLASSGYFTVLIQFGLVE